MLYKAPESIERRYKTGSGGLKRRERESDKLSSFPALQDHLILHMEGLVHR